MARADAKMTDFMVVVVVGRIVVGMRSSGEVGRGAVDFVRVSR